MAVEESKTDKLPIRIATPDDIPQLVELINRAYVAEASFVRGLRTDRLDLRGKMASANSWFLVLDAHAPGGALQLAACVFLECDDERGHIGLLSVNPDGQGHGLGARMLRAAEAHCQQVMRCPTIELDVVNLRTELFGFYEHMGYVRTGVLPFPDESRLTQPAHLVTMQKSSTATDVSK